MKSIASQRSKDDDFLLSRIDDKSRQKLYKLFDSVFARQSDLHRMMYNSQNHDFTQSMAAMLMATRIINSHYDELMELDLGVGVTLEPRHLDALVTDWVLSESDIFLYYTNL